MGPGAIVGSFSAAYFSKKLGGPSLPYLLAGALMSAVPIYTQILMMDLNYKLLDRRRGGCRPFRSLNVPSIKTIQSLIL